VIGNLIRRSVEERSTTIELPARSGTAQALFGPMNVSRDSLLSSVVANRCVALISDQLGSLPLHAERNGEPIATPALLAVPEIDRTRSEFMSALVTSLLINGNAFMLVGRRDDLGFPVNLVLLDPEAIQVTVVNGRPQYRTSRGLLNPEDVLHIANAVLPGHVMGYGPLDMNRLAIAQSLAADQYAGQRFVTGAVPDGVLVSDTEITSEQAQDLKSAWIAGNGGRQRGPAILSGGVSYKPLEFSSIDLELLDSRRYNALQTCTLFGVPAHLVQVPSQDSKTYSNLQQDSQSFVRYTLRPLAVKIEEALSTLLPAGDRAVFNFDAVLRADTKTRYEAHEIALRAGFMTTNEVRALEGLPPALTEQIGQTP
jgi:HK97 family phage portal protein